MQRFRRVGSVVFIVFIILGPLTLGWVPSRSYAALPVAPALQGALTPPFQSALAAALSQRQAAGLPVPTVTTTQTIAAALASDGGVTPPTPITTIRLQFDGPEQAGYEMWPRDVIGEIDYTEQYRAAAAAHLPGFWDRYEPGYEPRIYIITESLSYSAPTMATLSSGVASTTEDILMGFTFTGPHIDWTLFQTLCIPDLTGNPWCFLNVGGGLALDWAFGLRLPAKVTLTAPATVLPGETYRPSATLIPLDWEAGDYTQAGVAAEDGNEYLFEFSFYFGFTIEILGIDYCPFTMGCNYDLSIDESSSFTTPLGPGAGFSLATIAIPIFNISADPNEILPVPLMPGGGINFTVDLTIDPQLGTSGITADWRALGDATGSGTVTFTSGGTPFELGDVRVDNPAHDYVTQIELSNFQYWFNQFMIALGISVDFNIFNYGIWNEDVPLYTFDLSFLTHMTGLDSLAVGRHYECSTLEDLIDDILSLDIISCEPSGPDNVLVLTSRVGAGGAAETAAPSVPLCADLDGTTTETIRAHVPSDTVTNGSVFCRSLVENSVFVQDSAEIGKPEVLDRGVIQAVDVFALFHDGTPTAWFNHAPTVCLQGSGMLLYLDATAAPRTVAELPVFVQSGYTCGSIPSAGTVVLVDDPPGMMDSAPNPGAGTTTTLGDCMVTTLDIVNLRTQPDTGSPVVRMIPYNVTLTAFERSAEWFYVDYNGSRGWVSARFVSPQGSCG